MNLLIIMENISDSAKFKLAIFRMVISLIFLLNFLSCIVLHAKRSHYYPSGSRCVAMDDINHPVTILTFTDLDTVKDVGTMFFRVNLAGLSLCLCIEL